MVEEIIPDNLSNNKMNQDTLTTVFVVVSLGTVITLSALLSKKQQETYKANRVDNFNESQPGDGYKKCLCSSRLDKRHCQDIDMVQSKYQDGTLTEFTNLESPGWSKVSPGDINFPTSSGCPWGNSSNGKNKGWDYTNFVG